MNRTSPLLAAAALLVAGACKSSPTILTSLEDLTSETDRQGISSADQNRIVSITGLLPQAQVGTYYRYDSDRSPSTAIGISSDSTFMIESMIPPPADPKVGDEIVDAVTEVRAAGRVALEKLVDLAAARAFAAMAKQKDGAELLATAGADLAQQKNNYDKARAEFDAKLLETSKLIKHSGFIVVRWDSSSERDASTGAGALFSGNANDSSRSSGFAILSGLRLMTLFVGPDITEAAQPLRANAWQFWAPGFPWFYVSGRFPFIGRWEVPDYRLTTHLLQTRRVQYFQDVDLRREVSVAIEASYEQLGRLSSTLAEAEKLEAAYLAKSLSSLSNFGSLENVERAFFPVPLAPAAQQAKKELDTALKQRFPAPAENESDAAQREAVRAVLDEENAGFRAALNLDDGTCLTFTGRCIEDQIADRREQGLPALTPDMSGWLTIYAVDVNADHLSREFKTTR